MDGSSHVLLVLPHGGSKIHKAGVNHNAGRPNDSAAVPGHLYSQLDQRRELLLALQSWQIAVSCLSLQLCSKLQMYISYVRLRHGAAAGYCQTK